jgi:RNA polymerase sigma-B factor
MSRSTLSTRTTASAPPILPTQPAHQADRDRRAAYLLDQAATASPTERRRLLDEVVVLHLDLARGLAARYADRGVPREDLEQVACVALVKAAHGYDTAVGRCFVTYAIPTIRGEIKRYFRDHGWTVRPPRRVQELQARLSRAQGDLTASLGRSPRPAEMARHLDVAEEEVIEALSADGCFTPASLDRPVGVDGAATLGDLLSDEDRAQDAAEARTVLGPAVRHLAERDRRILMLRFFRGWTQQEIASDIGVTQMQVSRLLSRILADLRAELHDQTLDSS